MGEARLSILTAARAIGMAGTEFRRKYENSKSFKEIVKIDLSLSGSHVVQKTFSRSVWNTWIEETNADGYLIPLFDASELCFGREYINQFTQVFPKLKKKPFDCYRVCHTDYAAKNDFLDWWEEASGDGRPFVNRLALQRWIKANSKKRLNYQTILFIRHDLDGLAALDWKSDAVQKHLWLQRTDANDYLAEKGYPPFPENGWKK